ncbi:MAG: CRISPR-associated helicase Cas3' [Candidatus Riflebacteria bacterium]|nr:CRISPR-associated helicase Cas3' [Candidatus Riflebacteria bacterium]
MSCSILRQKLARLAGLPNLTGVQIARLSVFAAFHDLGKYNLGFQGKIQKQSKIPSAGHVKELLALFDSNSQYPETEKFCLAINYSDLCEWGSEECVFSLLVAAISHHGQPQPIGGMFRRDIWTPSNGLDPFIGMTNLGRLTRNWFPNAYEKNLENFPDAPEFQHAFNGLVTLADWISSDTRFFEFRNDPGQDRFGYAQKQAQKAISMVGLNITSMQLLLQKSSLDFETLFHFPPRPVQNVVHRLPTTKQGSLTILEAETGSGKTEAALSRFFQLFRVGDVDGMYFALPTRTAATQIFGRVCDFVARVFPEPQNRPTVVLAVPGYLRIDDCSGNLLPDYSVLWDDDPKGQRRFQGWSAEHPKKYLAACIAVGTIDQLLLSTLMVKHSHLRASSSLRHYLVVDEVHASDDYMNFLLEKVLTRHLKATGHVLLMSATLGSIAYERFLNLGKISKINSSFADAIKKPFPHVLFSPLGEPIKIFDIQNQRFQQEKKISLEILPIASDLKVIAEYAFFAANQGARVIILRNTVRDCQETQHVLEKIASQTNQTDFLFVCQKRYTPHHSRFAKEDREMLDEAIEGQFGCKSPAQGRILVATQTIQQSLDIDADYLLTDLCPIDVLLQRLGRLHRHNRSDRPSAFRQPSFVLLTAKQRDLGTFIIPRGPKKGEARGPNGIGSVYRDLRILEATWRLLDSHKTLIIPKMNRELVERGTHPEVLEQIIASLGGDWVAHDQYLKGLRQAHRSLASLNVVDWTVLFGEPQSKFPENLEEKISTRLGISDRCANFQKEVISPFGARIRFINIPFWMTKNVSEEAIVENIETASDQITFSYGSEKYRYSRFGLELAQKPDLKNQLEDCTDA